MTISPDQKTAPPLPPLRMLLSVAEVGAELGCGRDTVYALLASGRLPSVLIGERLRRIRRQDLEQYIANLQPHPPLPAPR